MAASYLIGILLVVLSAIAPRGIRLRARLRRIPSTTGTLLLCVALCALFALHLRIIDEAARHLALSHGEGIVPIPALNMAFLFRADLNARDSTWLQLIDIAQSLCLVLLVGVLRSTPRTPRVADAILAASAAVLAILALRAPGMESSDLYSYIGLAQAVPTPYHPAAIPLAGENAIVNRLWGLPLAPSPYGPLWWLISRALAPPNGTLGTEMLALRALELGALFAMLLSLAALGHSRRTLALIAVNPAIYALFVTEGHNDLLAASFLVAAAAIRRRSALGAVLLAACAGAIKLPFLTLAFLVFAPEPTLARRIGLGCAASALTLLATQLTVGAAYWQALRRVLELYPTAPTPLETSLQTLLALAALGAIAWAVFTRRVFSGAVWAFPALGHFPLPQYLAWSFPYALLAKRPRLMFLAALPLTVSMLNIDDTLTPFFLLLRGALVGVPTLLLARAILARGRERRA